ncbi:tetratricopeptide repeat-containing sulfotransferase family protein [Sedimentitalea todarodis]|uniref:Sulfotransferase n=1 Tax=Sedimentitalea todarodis TaxID=1631240 RepID=A0ABU3V8M2_9RHOB|nr:sulfotransferase [Sedimentitalea todarodis]MDU9002380.1 sulfotransferase [Sedimentitalea todarodis]
MPSQTTTFAEPPTLDVRKTLARADGARRAGDITGAARDYGAVLARFPGNPRARKALAAIGPSAASALADMAKSCEAAHQLDEAVQHWADAVALCPGHIALCLSLCRCLSDMGRNHAALDAVNEALRHNPDSALALDTKGCVLRDLGQMDAAQACHREALKHGGNTAGPLNHLGVLARATGDTDKAADFFRQAITASPGTASLHHNLAGCTTYRAGDAHIRQMQDQLADHSSSDPRQAPLHFALFKAMDETDDRDGAFAHLLRGNHLRKASSNFDIAREAYRFAWYKSLFAEPPAPMQITNECEPRPVYVVGLPRSGTTLAERILGQTPGAQTAGELSVVSNAVSPLLRRLQTEGRSAPTRQDLQTLRDRLLSGIKRHSDGSPILIDKMPLNFRWAGLICAAMPEARVVSLSRAPMPVAWSLFRHLFSSHGNGFAYDMADIAAYMLLHRDMMRFWSTRFASQIVSLDYAALVSETEDTLRELIDACDLEWSEACLNPQAAGGPVLTASATQVRRKIYCGSDDDWRRYEAHLSPLAAALNTAGLT